MDVGHELTASGGRVMRAHRGVPPSRHRLRRATVVVGLVLGLVLVVAAAAGWRVVVDRSDSMRPTLRAGDLLLLRPAVLADVAPGTVVTFPHPGDPGRTLTHRLVATAPLDDGLVVTTRGDANTAAERWRAQPSARVGVLAVRVPVVGRAVALVALPPVRAVLVTLLATAVAVPLLRATWRST